MKSLQLLEIPFQILSLKCTTPSFTLFMISASLLPLKGGYPESRMYVITPQDQMSHLQLQFFLMTSGAMQYAVPSCSLSYSLGSKTIDVPKSIIFIASHSLFSSRRMFSGLRSLKIKFDYDSCHDLPVNDFILMTIVYAREDLFHQDRSIPFSKFTTFHNLIKKLTSFANPTTACKRLF